MPALEDAPAARPGWAGGATSRSGDAGAARGLRARSAPCRRLWFVLAERLPWGRRGSWKGTAVDPAVSEMSGV